MSEVTYEVQNVVVTGKLADSLNLLEIYQKVPGAIYEPGKFPAVRLKLFGVGFLLYSSGRFVCSGSKSRAEAEEKVKKFVDYLRSYGIAIEGYPRIYVRNIVVSVDLNKSLRLHELAYAIPEAEYNPEAFPGMKIRKGNTRILIFRTGKAIIPGMRDEEEIERAINWLKETLEAAEEEIKTFKKPRALGGIE